MPKVIKNRGEEHMLNMARVLMDQYGLKDWALDTDRRATRAGACYESKKTIVLSVNMLRNPSISVSDVRNIVLHEIAHALVGVIHKHDEVWREKAIEIGSDGKQFHSLVFTYPKARVQCSGCYKSKVLYRLRKSWFKKVCSKCLSPIKVYWITPR